MGRPETAAALAAALPAAGMVALVPQRPAGAAAAERPSSPDWLRVSGKTQLAAGYADRQWHSGAVDLLAWIPATSQAAVLSGYAAATAAVTGRDQVSSCESVADQFLSWLAETSHPWLIVLDDLTAGEMDGLWPSGPAGRVLVTCAAAEDVPAGMPVLPVGLFSMHEAISYLTGRLSSDPSQRFGAMELAADLAAEPAALAQASAVIASSGVTCDRYRHELGRCREQMTRRQPGDEPGEPAAPPPASAVTSALSFEHAGRLTPNGWARPLLLLAAMLDGHGIPETVLTAPSAARFLAAGQAPVSGQAALAGLEALEAAGLASVEPLTPRAVRISPVLQAALRESVPGRVLEQAARAAADALTQAWPDTEPDPAGWPTSGMRSCARVLRQVTGDLLWSGGCHPVLLRSGESLDRAWLTGPAVGHWLDLVRTGSQLLGAADPDTVLATRRLAGAYLAAGRPEDAVSWFERLAENKRRDDGPDDPEVMEAQRCLGHALTAAGQGRRAITVLRDVADGFGRVYGPAHAATLGAQDELAAAFLAAGQPAAAITLYRGTLAARERTQGARHPETMTARAGLAAAYLAAGQAKEALSAYRKVVADRERVLGPAHLVTIRARSGLGAAYQATGKTAAAEGVLEQAWAGYQAVLGPRHPDTLRARAELAGIYRRLGRYGDARMLLRDTVGRLQRILAPDDPLITELRESLADIGDG